MANDSSEPGARTSKLALVCVGAGRGERFGGDKLAEVVAGRTVLDRSVAAIVSAFPEAPLYVVVAASCYEDVPRQLGSRGDRAHLVVGGARRQDSVRAGVEAAAAGGAEVVVVHDAARPMVHPEDVIRVVRALRESAGAVLCGDVADTVKRVGSDGLVVETIPREELRLAQTPQVFRVSALTEAWRSVDRDVTWTDEAAMLEALGLEVRAVLARHPNPKLTDRSDLAVIRVLAEST